MDAHRVTFGQMLFLSSIYLTKLLLGGGNRRKDAMDAILSFFKEKRDISLINNM